MEKAKQPSEFVKSLDKRLFWDVDIADIGERRHRRFIIQRVLERGSMGDIKGDGQALWHAGIHRRG